MSLGEQKIEMPIPGENDILKFTEIAKQLRYNLRRFRNICKTN